MKLILLLLVWSSIFTDCIALKLRSESSVGFDLFIFVRSWGPGYCSTTHCTRAPFSAFTIHGLWPEHNNGSWPEYCSDDADAIDSDDSVAADKGAALVPPAAMGCEWPSFSGTDAAFHTHEWSRHGTCAEPVLGGRDKFFEAVLLLNQRYDANVALERAGIVPSDTERYPASRIVAAVQDEYGVRPHLSCSRKGEVLELRMCVGLGLQAENCPPRVVAHTSCPARVLLPEGGQVPSSCNSFFPHLQTASMPFAAPSVLNHKQHGGAMA